MKRIVNEGGSLFWKLMVVVFLAALVATIIIPQRQRAEAAEKIQITRQHLIDLYLAERFFFEGRQYYTSDPESLLSYVNNVRSMRIDTLEIGMVYAAGDSIEPTDLWKIVGPRPRISRIYVSPIDSSAYMLIVKNEGVSITVKDRWGIGRIEDGSADWLEGRQR